MPEEIFDTTPESELFNSLRDVEVEITPADELYTAIPSDPWIHPETPTHVPLDFGGGTPSLQQPAGSSSTSSSSSSSTSTSVSSSSPPSSSTSSSPSSSTSSSPSSSTSPSSSSSKSTAIVPAEWSPTGYTALFIAECPDVRFDEVMCMTIVGRKSVCSIDPRFLSVCEPNTIEVVGLVGDRGSLKCARVESGRVVVERSLLSKAKVATVRLSGIRRGFLGVRFPTRTERQYEENEAFLNSAYSYEQEQDYEPPTPEDDGSGVI